MDKYEKYIFSVKPGVHPTFDCVLRLARWWPLAASHTRIVPSHPAEARRRPSGEKSTAHMASVCP